VIAALLNYPNVPGDERDVAEPRNLIGFLTAHGRIDNPKIATSAKV
jgi:hypothetical protein